MKATGIVRNVDLLGRIVIPAELRRTLDIDTKDPLEIFTEGDQILLRKYVPACILCGQEGELTEYKGKMVCRKCIEKLKEKQACAHSEQR